MSRSGVKAVAAQSGHRNEVTSLLKPCGTKMKQITGRSYNHKLINRQKKKQEKTKKTCQASGVRTEFKYRPSPRRGLKRPRSYPRLVGHICSCPPPPSCPQPLFLDASTVTDSAASIAQTSQTLVERQFDPCISSDHQADTATVSVTTAPLPSGISKDGGAEKGTITGEETAEGDGDTEVTVELRSTPNFEAGEAEVADGARITHDGDSGVAGDVDGRCGVGVGAEVDVEADNDACDVVLGDEGCGRRQGVSELQRVLPFYLHVSGWLDASANAAVMGFMTLPCRWGCLLFCAVLFCAVD